MEDQTLSKLVEQAKLGDQEAFASLYEQTRGSVYFLALRLMKSEQDALDAVQESYIKAFTRLDELNNNEAFSSWLATILTNTARAKLRSKAVETVDDETVLENAEEIGEDFLPQEYIENQAKRNLILDIIDRLPELQRTTVMLFYYESMSIASIAHIMQCNENTVKSRLTYAKRFIKKELEALEKEGTKLYGVAAIPALAMLLQEAAKQTNMPVIASHKILASTLEHMAKNMPAPALAPAATSDVVNASAQATPQPVPVSDRAPVFDDVSANSGKDNNLIGLFGKITQMGTNGKIAMAAVAAVVVVAAVSIPLALNFGKQKAVETAPTIAASSTASVVEPTPVTSSAPEPEPEEEVVNWKQIYYDFLEDFSDGGVHTFGFNGINLYDLDNDGIPELRAVIIAGASTASHTVYTIRDGVVEKFLHSERLGGEVTFIYYNIDSGEIILHADSGGSSGNDHYSEYSQLIDGEWQCIVTADVPGGVGVSASSPIIATIYGEKYRFNSYEEFTAMLAEKIGVLEKLPLDDGNTHEWRRETDRDFLPWSNMARDLVEFFNAYDSSIKFEPDDLDSIQGYSDAIEAQISASGGLRMREGAGTNDKIIKVIRNYEYITVLNQDGDWVYVEHDGDYGWVSAEFILYEWDDGFGAEAPEWAMVFSEYLSKFRFVNLEEFNDEGYSWMPPDILPFSVGTVSFHNISGVSSPVLQLMGGFHSGIHPICYYVENGQLLEYHYDPPEPGINLSNEIAVFDIDRSFGAAKGHEMQPVLDWLENAS